jgi:serine phosphatase RsbU (regulator of sigma subunit)
LIQGLEVTTLATASYARLERRSAGGWRITYSSAGHPPLLVRLPDGSVSDLDGADGLLLGVDDHPRTSATRDLPAGTVVLGYTDGLIERRGSSLDAGLAALRRSFAGASDDLEHLANHLIARHGDSEDDVALIAVRLGG